MITFARQMKSTFRDSDLLGRLGGDGFVALLNGTSRQHAEYVAERLSDALETYSQEANRGYDISFSRGIVEFNPDNRIAIEELLAAGDLLMYEAKLAQR